MKNLLIYLKSYKKETALAPLFKMLEALLELFVPLVVKLIIDNGIGGGDKSYVVRMCLVLCAFAAAGLAFSITAQFFAAKAAVGFSKQLRSSLFSHIGTFSFSQLDIFGSSTLLTRMTSDINQVQNGVNLTLRLLLRSPFVVFGAVIMAFTVDARSGLIFLGTVPVLSLVIFGIMRITIPLYKKVQTKLDAVLSSARQSLTGVRVIRAFGREERETEDFIARNEALTSSQKTAGRISALMNPLTYVIINIAIIVLVYTGGIRVNAGLLTQGAVVALYNYMSQILTELIKLANLIVNITKSEACAKRIQAVFDEKTDMLYPEKSAEPDFSAPAVEIINAALQYKGSAAPSLENINISVNAHEKIGVIGSTGSGKTSFVNIIPRFYDVTSGEVRVFGRNVKEYSQETLNSLIADVPQKAVLFKGTIRENLLWGNENADDAVIEEALSAAQAKEVVSSKPQGLDAPVEQGGKNFSGGQKQRLTAARALVKRSPVLILDDAASALDLATDLKLRRAIAALDYNPCVFIVSQRTASVMNCDKIIVLEDGRISAVGTHKELLISSPVYAEIYNAQFGGVENG